MARSRPDVTRARQRNAADLTRRNLVKTRRDVAQLHVRLHHLEAQMRAQARLLKRVGACLTTDAR